MKTWNSPDDYARALSEAAVRGDVIMPDGEPLFRDRRVCLRWDLILAAHPARIEYASDMWKWARMKAWGGVIAAGFALLGFLLVGMISPIFALLYLAGAVLIGKCLKTWPLELSIAMCKTLQNLTDRQRGSQGS
jgi:hypothetical protein